MHPNYLRAAKGSAGKCGSSQIYGIMVPNVGCIKLPDNCYWRIHDMKYIPFVVDIAKHVMLVHFIDEHTGEVIDKQIKRDALLEYFSNRRPCLICMEACGGSQYKGS